MTDSQQPIAALLSWRRFSGRSAHDLGGVEHRIRSQMRGLCRQQLLLAIDQICGVEGCKLESVTMGDRVGRARLDAVSAENATVIVDVVNRSEERRVGKECE